MLLLQLLARCSAAHPLHPGARESRSDYEPTNDGLTIGIVIYPIEEFEAVKSDIEGCFWASAALAPAFADLLLGRERAERFYGTADIENFFRKPFGPGWALAGDAGYHKDPCTAQGISDAFQSVEWLASAIHQGLSGSRPMSEALAEYQQVRDSHFLPMYDFTWELAQLAPPPPPIQALYQALCTNQAEADRFFGTMAGTVSIPEFFAPENIARITEGGAGAFVCPSPRYRIRRPMTLRRIA